MNDMNELTNKLQQVMVPKAALIAYEYRENRYGNGMHYLELHPINDRGRMEAAMPVTYEFMDSLVESYTDDRRNVPHGKGVPDSRRCSADGFRESACGPETGNGTSTGSDRSPVAALRPYLPA